jgi:hypothetical protein
VVHINPVLSLAVIVCLLGAAIVTSLIAARREVAEAIEHADEPLPEPAIPADLRSEDASGDGEKTDALRSASASDHT